MWRLLATLHPVGHSELHLLYLISCHLTVDIIVISTVTVCYIYLSPSCIVLLRIGAVEVRLDDLGTFWPFLFWTAGSDKRIQHAQFSAEIKDILNLIKFENQLE